MTEDNACCGNCAYHDNFTGVCFNGDSEHRADFTENDYKCEVWVDVHSKSRENGDI